MSSLFVVLGSDLSASLLLKAVSDMILNSSNPVVKGLVDNASLAVTTVNKFGAAYTPLQLVVISAGSTYVLSSIWNFFMDIDVGLW